MANDLLLQLITVVYVGCNAVRLFSYIPQIIAVARERSGAHALSLATWCFWTLSNAATAIYCSTVINDFLLASTMWGNAVGCLAVALLTVMKRQRYGWRRSHPTPVAIGSSRPWPPSHSEVRHSSRAGQTP